MSQKADIAIPGGALAFHIFGEQLQLRYAGKKWPKEEFAESCLLWQIIVPEIFSSHRGPISEVPYPARMKAERVKVRSFRIFALKGAAGKGPHDKSGGRPPD